MVFDRVDIVLFFVVLFYFFFFKQKTAYEMRISDWSSDVCSSDLVEGLILVDIDTMADGELRNNKLTRALTWNPDNVLAGARHITLAGDYAYIAADSGLVVVDLSTPLEPKATARLPLTDARASAVQFRYLWVRIGRAWCGERVWQ